MTRTTKAVLAEQNAALRARVAALESTVNALKVQFQQPKPLARQPLYVAFTREEAFRVRNALAAKKVGNHPWAVQPGPRVGTFAVL